MWDHPSVVNAAWYGSTWTPPLNPRTPPPKKTILPESKTGLLRHRTPQKCASTGVHASLQTHTPAIAYTQRKSERRRLSLSEQTGRLKIQADTELTKQLKKNHSLLKLSEMSSYFNDGEARNYGKTHSVQLRCCCFDLKANKKDYSDRHRSSGPDQLK